mgnify:CR=1 FL=1
MNHIIFDIDGTLTQSTGFDSTCFKSAVLQHADVSFKNDWSEYRNVTDTGILNEIIATHDLAQIEAELTSKIKSTFINKIESHLNDSPVDEIPGAKDFIDYLMSLEEVRVAIATGGWKETAELKLRSAGFTYQDIPLYSSNDSHSRVEIMKLADQKIGTPVANRVSYFGDASWDKEACSVLGWNFILVGNRTNQYKRIESFEEFNRVLQFCGILK